KVTRAVIRNAGEGRTVAVVGDVYRFLAHHGNCSVFAHRAHRHDPMVRAETAPISGRAKGRGSHQHPLAWRNPASLQGASAADQDLERINRSSVCSKIQGNSPSVPAPSRQWPAFMH